VKAHYDQLTENIDQVSNGEKPKVNWEFPAELDMDSYFKYLDLVYIQFRWKMYHGYNALPESGNGSNAYINLIKSAKLKDMKKDIWTQLKMPTSPGISENDIIINVQCDILLNREESAAKLGDMQKEHMQILQKEIPTGKKFPQFEKEPLIEFLKTEGTFPFKK